ncbi:hypothetical protein CVT24_001727 [Panaeolus cyanescens]|uniref:Pyridoxamine 5'-phosphate oxidase N-terminal domain-containing protein n=1 Tax=Panaeolus cyanescens TaxID=181874 RepID=A0A409YFQ0_9AGAR|nr:hypothetical protein CVT24_001727 [Panaeolus cyanescens]
MVKFYDTIPDHIFPWIQQQKIFFVSTAPLSQTGHVNVSPKGFSGTFHAQDEKTVWYEDLTGSGTETISHLRENGRITIMFVAFTGPPQILRLFGTGTVHEFGSPEYNRLLPPGTRQPGSRAAIFINVHKVSTSCGYSIPFYEFKKDRMRLHNYMASLEAKDLKAEEESKSPSCSADGVNASDGQVSERPKGLKWYWTQKNLMSIDGLPSLLEAFDAERGFDRSTAGKNWGADDERAGSEIQGPANVDGNGLFGGKVDVKLVVGFVAGVVCANAINLGRVWDTARRLGNFE